MAEYPQWFKDGYNYAHKEITTPNRDRYPTDKDVLDMLEAVSYGADDDFDRGISKALRDYDNIMQGKKGLM